MPHIFAVVHDYSIFVCFKKFATLLLKRNKATSEILLKDKGINSLVLQLSLLALVVVYVETRAREKAPVHCNRAIGVGMLNDAVAGVKQ